MNEQALQAALDMHNALLIKARTERDALAAENARLREALEAIRDDYGDDETYPGVHDEWTESVAFSRCQDIARAALESEAAHE